MPSDRSVRRISVILAALSAAASCKSSPTAPLDFSTVARTAVIPASWGGTIGPVASYEIGTFTGETHGGARAGYIRSIAAIPTPFADIVQIVKPDSYRGKRVRFSGWFRQVVHSATASGLWMRVDGPSVTLAFDNMQPRPETGSRDWHRDSVVLDVPANALGISLGILFDGIGEIEFDDLALEVVATSVPSTSFFSAPQPSTLDSATAVAVYAAARTAPVNLGFEGAGTSVLAKVPARLIRP